MVSYRFIDLGQKALSSENAELRRVDGGERNWASHSRSPESLHGSENASDDDSDISTPKIMKLNLNENPQIVLESPKWIIFHSLAFD